MEEEKFFNVETIKNFDNTKGFIVECEKRIYCKSLEEVIEQLKKYFKIIT